MLTLRDVRRGDDVDQRGGISGGVILKTVVDRLRVAARDHHAVRFAFLQSAQHHPVGCLLYTSDAADE